MTAADWQGDWQVKRGGKLRYKLSINGTKARVTDTRFGKERVTEGDLTRLSDIDLAVRNSKGVTYFFRALKHENTIFFGNGSIWRISDSEDFQISAGVGTSIKVQGTTCWLVDSSHKERTTPCKRGQNNGYPWIEVDGIPSIGPVPQQTRRLYFVGDYVLPDRLFESRAVRSTKTRHP
jgi:hypothetical protein